MHQRGTAERPFGQRGQVVHPAVVGAYIAPADDDQIGCWACQVFGGALQVINEKRGCQLDLAAGCAQHLRHAGLQFTQINATVGVGRFDLIEGQSTWFQAEMVAIGAGAQSHFEATLRSTQSLRSGDDRRRMLAEQALDLFGKLGVVQCVGMSGRRLCR